MTNEQLLASDPARSVWVSASAGTGKTKVLTDRVLRLMLGGTAPGSILCVTYTNAAAAEMLDRIERQLGAWAVMEEAALTSALTELCGGTISSETVVLARQLFARVLDAPDKLRVQTIHGFCQSVIARFPLEAGVSPHAALLDEHDAQEMLEDARSHLFMDARAPASVRIAATLRELAQTLAESTLKELLAKIVSVRRQFADLLELPGGVDQFSVLLHQRLQVQPGQTEAKLCEKHFAYTQQEENALRGVCEALLQTGGKNNGATASAIAQWLERRADAWGYCASFFTDKGTVRATLYTKAAAESMAELPDIIQAEAARAERFMRDCKTLRVIKSTEHMMVLAIALLERYRDEKQRRGVIDYDDLILYTAQLLQRSDAAAWVLFKLDGTIDHLLVDEGQDTSPEQWKIVDALVTEFYAGESARSRDRTLFVVGDEKQSIFSFQGADPSLFDAIRLKLSKRAQAAGKLFSHVRLDLSFRSTEAVLAAVDSVFATPAARDGLVFSQSDLSHEAHRKGQPGRVELWPLMEGEKPEKQHVWDALGAGDYTPSAEQRMAQALAEEISGWLARGRLLASQGRPVRPGDIMILVQRRGGFAGAMLRALKRAGVPVAGADRLVITEHIAVMDCMALADFLLLPQDDLTLAALLKSPLIGLDEQALFTLAHNRGKQSLWQRLRASGEYAEAADFLSQMLALTDYMAPYELFSHALVTLGKRKEIAARLGKEAEDPLNEFLSLALRYERSHPPSLQGFMHWLRSSETEIKRDMEKGRDEVRILTVHASKGLQAPIVFLPDTTRLPRPADSLQWLQGDMKLPLWSEAKECDDMHIGALKQASREESMREYRRLLYVAMTRAEDELYICGWKGGRAVQEGCWYELVKNAVESSGVWQNEGERKVLVNAGNAARDSAPAVKESPPAILPAWAQAKAAGEPKPSRPLSPSKLDNGVLPAQPQSAPAARARGVLVHRLLQYLPGHPAEQHGEIIERFMARYGEALPLRERNEVVRQVTNVLNDEEFAAVFGGNSVAEAPIVGVVDGKGGEKLTIAGQIDRLAILGDTVLVVDYKTGRDVPEDAAGLPEAYTKQLNAYRTLLQRIYPEKTVKCGILFTAAPKLIALE